MRKYNGINYNGINSNLCLDLLNADGLDDSIIDSSEEEFDETESNAVGRLSYPRDVSYPRGVSYPRNGRIIDDKNYPKFMYGADGEAVPVVSEKIVEEKKETVIENAPEQKSSSAKYMGVSKKTGYAVLGIAAIGLGAFIYFKYFKK
jgi:hypothetical protein